MFNTKGICVINKKRQKTRQRVNPEWPLVKRVLGESTFRFQLRGSNLESVDSAGFVIKVGTASCPTAPLADPCVRFSRTGLLAATRSVEFRCMYTIVGVGFEVRRHLQLCGELAFPNSST